MLIIGAKGFAKEVLELLDHKNDENNIVFYDDISENVSDFLFKKFKVLTNLESAELYFRTVDSKFTIGVGNPVLRKMLFEKFSLIGGEICSTISPQAIIGSYDVTIGKGTNVLSGAIFSNSVSIGLCGIVYYHAVITHDCRIGDFVEISPGVKVLGRVHIGSYTQIGAGATILPDVRIGNNVIIGAGSVVTKDLPSNCIAVGTPARILRFLEPLSC
jgi:sugar O-acyltransferase (sialic acid O-acetyltransferase NeuD family)